MHGLRARRPHLKSRSGCQKCKRRKVKCDETKPECKNCVKYNVVCDFNTQANAQSIQSVLRENTRPRRGRPPKHQFSAPDIPMTETNSIGNSMLNCADLELMYQYTTSTYKSVGAGNETVWRDSMSEIAFSYNFVLHLMLATAAAELAYLRPEQREHYNLLVDHHFSTGIRKASEILAQLNEKNCQALFMATSLASLCIFAKGPRPGDYLVFSDQGQGEWMSILRGIRSITEMIGPETLFSGGLEYFKKSFILVEKSVAAERGWHRLDWEPTLKHLTDFIKSSRDPKIQIYLEALRRLIKCYEATWGIDEAGTYNGKRKYQTVIIWLYSFSDEFQESLWHKDQIALLLVAYFIPVFRTISGDWFRQGWCTHILEGICRYADAKHSPLLEWPVNNSRDQPRERYI